MVFDYTGQEICMFSPTREYGVGFEYNEKSMIVVVEKLAGITRELIMMILWNFCKMRKSERAFIKQCIEKIYTTPRDKVYDNPELLKAALEEAGKCKKTNLEMPAKCKINI
ncbi:MAG: hypothetical protein K2M78_17975 [Lachnospiraceae bacterium]|nr:hypothetical protein [Lachnospiraceae bacterium]